MKRRAADTPIVAAVSGGPDSVFLLRELLRTEKRRILVAHVNHGLRGRESEKDQKLVEELADRYRVELRIRKEKPGKTGPGLEEKARKTRHAFLGRLARETGGVVATGHTADDQVETILMRVLEGAGIAGLKGIPRDDDGRMLRPVFHCWKEDILNRLKREVIPYRLDRTNRDCRFERNWIRNVLVPLLEKRYGASVKRRIFTLGERFRELDDYLGHEALRWIRRNVKENRRSHTLEPSLRRASYSGLPTALRIKVLQAICFRRLALSPNERLLASMDKSICVGKPSNRVKAGGGWELVNRYEEARFVSGAETGGGVIGELRVEAIDNVTPALARRISGEGESELFDADALHLPLSVRPLRKGDRIRPFGRSGEKKLKEILIDRKVPVDRRWGRPVVCDATGAVLWVPGLLRSGHAPVTAETRCAKIVSYFN